MKYAIIMILLIIGTPGCSADYWFTPDQQGDRLMKSEKFEDAARVYVDPLRKGVALFRSPKTSVLIFYLIVFFKSIELMHRGRKPHSSE